jgi:Sec-independent protein secretion pathway component TatC
MFLMMAPLTALYFIAVGIAMANDKRREKKLAKLGVESELELD